MTSTEQIEAESALTAARLRELLDYDPATGIFINRVSRGRARVAAIAGSLRDDGYRLITIDGVRYLAHRLAWLYVHGDWPPGDLDHEDTNKDHNWIANLRLATMSQNLANRPAQRNNTSGFKGVSFDRARQKWVAHIRKNGRTIQLGRFLTCEAAHAAYVAKAKELFDEFANAGQ